MRKKLLSLCMALALCLGLLPVTALAAAPNGQVIYVGNENVTNGGYWTTDSAGTVTAFTGEGTPADNFIYYDASRNTLTLHNATIRMSVSINTNSLLAGAAIGVLNQYGDGNAELTITLEGTNTIAEVGKGIYVLADSTGGATLTITGDGSLDASASQTGIWVQSNNGNGALFIQNAKVEATGTSYGVNVQSSNSSTAALTVDGGSLTASGSPGILYDSIGSGTVPKTTALTISNSAIVDARNGEIGAGSTTNLQPVPPSGNGIVFNGDDGTVYGVVTLKEDLTIGEGESLTIPDNSSLNTNGNTITVENGGKLEGTINGNQPPMITASPVNQTVEEGSSAAFSVTASASEGEQLTYQWQQKTTDSESEWGDISNATTASYTIEATTTSMNDYQYRCVVKSASGVSVISQAATLTVTALPEPEPEPEPTPPPYIPPTYAVTAPETTGGTVTVSPSRASSGRMVTITATPDLGYELERLTVRDSRGNEIALTDKGDGKYTFTMPASRVTVEASFTPAPLPFEDVAPGAWYESAVRYAYLHDIMEGMSATTFQPNGTLSRAMAVQIFYNLEGQPDVSDENLGYPYEDVNAQAWYGNAVYWARLTGVATGYGDGTFQPTDSITRQEFAQMLYNYAKYKGYDLTAEGDLSQFPDSGSVADWAEAAMSWANGNELINGHDDGTIDAGGAGTRAQAASILMRFDQNLVEK